jgi:23S rRNA (cytosine1962-C5)-methyltransferase
MQKTRLGHRQLQVGPETVRVLELGHPWVIADRFTKRWPQLECGSLAALVDGNGRFLGTALIDAQARIVARVLSSSHVSLDEGFLLQRLRSADEGRRWLEMGETDAWRMLNAEADGLSGLTIDRYGDFAMVQYYTPAWEKHLPLVANAVQQFSAVRGVYAKYRPQETRKLTAGDRKTEAGGRLIAGREAPRELTVKEHGLRYSVDLGKDLHTGIFPDQRQNRLQLRKRTADCTVLNLFAYTGAFSVAAAAGGARKVTSVDANPRYLDQARQNFILNSIDPQAHEFVAGDCFAELDRFGREGRCYDIILMDPPSFSSTRHSRFTTGGGTAELVAKSLGLLDIGGLLITSTNLQKMTLADYLKELRKGCLAAGRLLQVVEVAGQAPDFPFLATFPEGQYLKYVVSVVKEKF